MNATRATPLPSTGTYAAQNQSVKLLIQQAYGLKTFQIEGGPKWIDYLSSDTYDIAAKAEGPVTREQLMLVLQMLHRFKLTYHYETRQLPIYALVIAKQGVFGPNLHEPNLDEPRLSPVRGAGGRIDAANATMQDLAAYLSGFTGGRLVLNRTGLTEHYAFGLEWTPDPANRPALLAKAPPPPTNAPSLFQALQEQLGLKLESDKGSVEIMIIDQVEKPTEN